MQYIFLLFEGNRFSSWNSTRPLLGEFHSKCGRFWQSIFREEHDYWSTMDAGLAGLMGSMFESKHLGVRPNGRFVSDSSSIKSCERQLSGAAAAIVVRRTDAGQAECRRERSVPRHVGCSTSSLHGCLLTYRWRQCSSFFRFVTANVRII